MLNIDLYTSGLEDYRIFGQRLISEVFMYQKFSDSNAGVIPRWHFKFVKDAPMEGFNFLMSYLPGGKECHDMAYCNLQISPDHMIISLRRNFSNGEATPSRLRWLSLLFADYLNDKFYEEIYTFQISEL